MRALTHQMTWSCSFRFVVFECCSMNSWTSFNSWASPASNPRESWKMKPGLPLNIISFWMSCSPRCGVGILLNISHWYTNHSEFLTFKDGLRADDSIWDYWQWMSVSGIKFHDMPHLFTIRTEDCRFFRSVAESLQDCRLACVSPPDHKDTESRKLCWYFLNLLCSELRLWWGRHCERCSRWCGMIRPFKLWLSQEWHLAQVIPHFHYSLCAATTMYVRGRWKSVQQCPSCSW